MQLSSIIQSVHFAYQVCKHKQEGCLGREEGFRADPRQVWTAHGAGERPLRPFSDNHHREQIRNDRADMHVRIETGCFK